MDMHTQTVFEIVSYFIAINNKLRKVVQVRV